MSNYSFIECNQRQCHPGAFYRWVSVCLLCLTGGRELHSDCLALVQAPTVQAESQLTLPLDINNYPISKFIQLHFRVSCAFGFIPNLPLKSPPKKFGDGFDFALQEPMFGMLTAPLKMPLTHLDDDLTQEALDIFIMVEMSHIYPVLLYIYIYISCLNSIW